MFKPKSNESTGPRKYEIEAMIREAIYHTVGPALGQVDAAHTGLWRYLCGRVIEGDAAREKLEERVRKLEERAAAETPTAPIIFRRLAKEKE